MNITQKYKEAIQEGYTNVMTPVAVKQQEAGEYLVILETDHRQQRWGVTTAKKADTASGLEFNNGFDDADLYDDKNEALDAFQRIVKQITAEE
jgi:hypothetical protein